MVMRRTVRLPKCGVQMFNYFTLDATVPPRHSPAGVRAFGFPRFGRLSRSCVASNFIPSYILDATAFSCWRPCFWLSPFWTPSISICGVQFHPILYSGRHVHHSLASILPTFSILDAPHLLMWRPIPSHPLFWTPCPSLSGVHPSNLLNFGRLPFSCVASNSIPSSILDAMSITLWRPSFQPSQFWTPLTSLRGVHFHPILYSGRPSLPYVASIFISSSILDAMLIALWRPSFQPFQFWTPSISLHGVQLHLILSSGRHGTPTAFSCWRPSFQLFPY